MGLGFYILLTSQEKVLIFFLICKVFLLFVWEVIEVTFDIGFIFCDAERDKNTKDFSGSLIFI